jgi:outer membrane protein
MIGRIINNAVVLAALSAMSLAAQQAPRTITFDEAVTIALHRHTGVLQAENAMAADEATVRQEKLGFLPDLRLSVSGSNSLGRNFDTGSGRVVDETSQSLNTGISTSVTLFDGFRNVADLRRAELGAKASEQTLERAKQTAVFSVASNFLALVTAKEQLGVQRQSLAALQTQEKQVQTFVQAGIRPISDLYQQQASVAATRTNVVEAERALELAKVDLMQTLQLDPGATYDFVAPTVDDSAAVGRTYQLDSLLARAIVRRADLDAGESEVAAATQGVRAAQAGKLPTITLSGGYNTGYSSAAELPIRDQLDQRRGGSLSLGVSIPLFDRGNASVATQQARLQESNARLALTQQKQEIALQVRRAYLDHAAAQQRLVAADAQRKAADQALAAVRERYRVGAATLVELTQAQAGATQAASATVNARYTLVFQQALMSYYTGELEAGTVKEALG